jgi:hypothetical protein
LVPLDRAGSTSKDSKGVTGCIPSDSESRSDAAKPLFLPLARAFAGLRSADFGALVLAASGPAETQFPTNKVPFGRNLEQPNFTGLRGDSQGDSQAATVIYVVTYQSVTVAMIGARAEAEAPLEGRGKMTFGRAKSRTKA